MTMYFPMIFSHFILLSALTEIVTPSIAVEMRFLSFRSDKGTLKDGRCCDNTNRPAIGNPYSSLCFMYGDSCDYRFDICLRTLAFQSTNSQDKCWTIPGDFINAQSLVSFNNAKLLEVSSWPQRLTIQVRDLDRNGGVEVVDEFKVNISMAPFPNRWVAQPVQGTLRGSYSKSRTFTLNVTVYCEDNYYGSDCGRWCQPTDYLRYCDASGAIQCFLHDNDGKCVRACDLSPCLHNGMCRDNITHYWCQCQGPWYGQRCSQHPCDTLYCDSNAFCQLQANTPTCVCKTGFTGVHCQTPSYTSTCSSHNCAIGSDNDCGLLPGHKENCDKTTPANNPKQESSEKGALMTQGVLVTESLTLSSVLEIQPSWSFSITKATAPLTQMSTSVYTTLSDLPPLSVRSLTQDTESVFLLTQTVSSKQTASSDLPSRFSISSRQTAETLRPSIQFSPSIQTSTDFLSPDVISLERTLQDVQSSTHNTLPLEIATSELPSQYSVLPPLIVESKQLSPALPSQYRLSSTQTSESLQPTSQTSPSDQSELSNLPSLSIFLSTLASESVKTLTQIVSPAQTTSSDLQSQYIVSSTETSEFIQPSTLISPFTQTTSSDLQSQYIVSSTETSEFIQPSTLISPSTQPTSYLQSPHRPHRLSLKESSEFLQPSTQISPSSADLPSFHSLLLTETAERVQLLTQLSLLTQHTQRIISLQSSEYHTSTFTKPPFSTQLQGIKSLPYTTKTPQTQSCRRIAESSHQSEPFSIAKGVSLAILSTQNLPSVQETAYDQFLLISPISKEEFVSVKPSDKIQPTSTVQQTPHYTSTMTHQLASEVPVIQDHMKEFSTDAALMVETSATIVPTAIQPTVGIQGSPLQTTTEARDFTLPNEPFAPQVDKTVMVQQSMSAWSAQDFPTSSVENEQQSKSPGTHLTPKSIPERTTTDSPSFSNSQKSTENPQSGIVQVKFWFSVTPKDVPTVTEAIASYLVGKVPLCQSLSETVVTAVDHQRLPGEMLSFTIDCNDVPIDQADINPVIADDNDDFIDAINSAIDLRRRDDSGDGGGQFVFILAGATGGSVLVIVIVIVIFCVRNNRNSSKTEEEKSVMFRNPIYGNSNV